METKNFPQITIATVGHIDHGKSTLLGRLLYDSEQVKPDKIEEMEKAGGEFAYLLDSFEEEQKNEMTIDIFCTRFKTPKYQFTLIDNPGHLAFIKNMLTGTSQATGVILVVSAIPGEGVEFQTKRHMKLVRLLGIKQILVAVNKMDLIGYRQDAFLKIQTEVKTLLKKVGFSIKEIYFIPIAAKIGDNIFHRSAKMSWYQGKTLYQLLDLVFSPPPSQSGKPLRVSLQGSYQFQKELFVFGRVESGILKKGQEIIFSPSERKTKILKIKGASGERKQAFPGETVGFAIQKESLAKLENQVVGDPKDKPRVVISAQEEIFLLSNKPLKRGENLTFSCGTINVPCKLGKILVRMDSEKGKVIEKNAIQVLPSEMARVQIDFWEPAIAEKYTDFPSLGRFLLFKGRKNVAAGITLN